MKIFAFTPVALSTATRFSRQVIFTFSLSLPHWEHTDALSCRIILLLSLPFLSNGPLWQIGAAPMDSRAIYSEDKRAHLGYKWQVG